MKKEMLKKAVANAVVDIAIQTSKVPHGICIFSFGEPKAKYNLTHEDFECLAKISKHKGL